MKGFDVLKVKSAVKTRNKFDLSCSHLTTMDFGEIVPLYSNELVPGDKFDIDANYFARMAPLVKPTYGKFSFKTVAAFVPYHELAYDAEAWLAGKTVFEGMTPKQRNITLASLYSFLADSSISITAVNNSAATIDNCDWHVIDSSGNDVFRVWTPFGKYVVKILNALGYAIPQGIDLQTNSDWSKNQKTKTVSAYPLLAFFKLYNDYMTQSTKYNTSDLSEALRCIKYGLTHNAISGGQNITIAGLQTLFNSIRLNYENDYFTSAWQYPNCPVASIESVNAGLTPGASYTGETVSAGNFENTVNEKVTSSVVSISQKALDFLKDFDDWVRRNNYAGARAVQQIYSRFGIKSGDYKSHYAQVISTDSMPIQVGDVTATADAESVPLGDYAGKGIMSGSKTISYSASDFGILLILGYFTVTPMNAYGFDRSVLRSSPLDYYNPEFDGMGADAISASEYFENPIWSGDSTNFGTIFGYTERYNAYRFGRDKITGEFRNYRNDGDMNVWHTGRLLNDARRLGNLVAQSVTVNTMSPYNSEYNRIFSVTDGSVNHFYVTARFNVSAVRPMLSLNQVPRLGEGDTVVPRNGNIIS